MRKLALSMLLLLAATSAGAEDLNLVFGCLSKEDTEAVYQLPHDQQEAQMGILVNQMKCAMAAYTPEAWGAGTVTGTTREVEARPFIGMSMQEAFIALFSGQRPELKTFHFDNSRSGQKT